MNGGLTEVTGWSVDRAVRGARKHVDTVLAQGGFARIVPIDHGRVVWLGPDGEAWKFVPPASIPTPEERREARRLASLALAEQRKAKRAAKGLANRAAARQAKADAKAAAKRRRNTPTRKRPSWTAMMRSGPALTPGDLRRARKVLSDVAEARGVTLVDMLGEDRVRPVAFARFEAMWRLRELRAPDGRRLFSLPRIGRLFGRDHTSVLHALRRHAQLNGLTLEPELMAQPRTTWSRAA